MSCASRTTGEHKTPESNKSVGQKQMRIHLILNAYWEPLDFELPPRDQGGAHAWRRWIDTALDTPHDIVPWQTAPAVSGSTYRAEARAVVALFAGGYARRAVC
jgi:isoamylase